MWKQVILSSRSQDIKTTSGRWHSHPTEKHLQVQAFSELYLWNTTTSNQITSIRIQQRELNITLIFSPDSNILVSGNQYGVIQLWDAYTGDILSTRTGHAFWIKCDGILRRQQNACKVQVGVAQYCSGIGRQSFRQMIGDYL